MTRTPQRLVVGLALSAAGLVPTTHGPHGTTPVAVGLAVQAGGVLTLVHAVRTSDRDAGSSG